MKLFEMTGRLPTRAGKARLHFEPLKTHRDHSEPIKLPFRKAEDIGIPFLPEAEFYPILKNQQFLFRMPFDNGSEKEAVFFGGTDEEPFLVRVKPEIFTTFIEGGERGFFSTLKPMKIRKLEEELRLRTLRQGDIFAFPLHFSWEMLRAFRALVYYDTDDLEPVSVKNKKVFGTRHVIDGLQLILEGDTFGEGILHAPDHEDLQLAGKVHLLAQAEYLYTPELAD